MKRFVVAMTMVVTLVVSSGSALADKPARSCPDRFRLATLQDIIDIFGPEGNVPAIENFFEAVDKNEDELICAKDHPSGVNGIDNTANQ